MRRKFSMLCTCAFAICMVAGLAHAQAPIINLMLDGTTYVLGEDSIDVSVMAINVGPDINVDVHFAVLPPGGGILEVPNWNTNFVPLFSNLTLPSYFNYNGGLATYSVGDYPFNLVGNYTFAAAFSEPGTVNFIGDISFVPFTVVDAGNPEGSSASLGVSYVRAYDTYSEEWETSVSAAGTFLEYYESKGAIALGDETEGCEVSIFDADDNGETGSARYLDAGDKIDMHGSPMGTVELTKFEFMDMIMYSTDELEPSYYSGGTNFTFQGYGGPDVGAFSGSVEAPAIVELYAPTLAPVPTISRSSSLNVEWNGTGSGFVYVSVTSFEIDPSTYMPKRYSCVNCVFEDDGDGTIPSDMMGQLFPSTGISYFLPSFSISRANHSSFNASGLSEEGMLYSTAEVYGDIDLQ
ncbi:MAG: hypothetical protein JW941_00215 [Candidatus Coatesbacteria bacterium]|nr:hypothetical protein [Candidatus Coatesbacteria bacterium]